MGDRGNVCIREVTEDTGMDVYLYTHWRGSDLVDIVRDALAKRQRWNDAPYLTRIVFNEVQADDRRETGFGISAVMGDNNNPVVVVDVEAQTVAVVKYEGGRRIPASYDEPRVKFEEFVKRRSEPAE